MNSSRQIAWPKIFAEGAAIVVSILLAFWIDAWWEARQQKGVEAALLQNLLEDLTEQKSRLEYQIAYNQAILESAKTLLNTAAHAQPTIDQDEIDHLIGFTWWYNAPTYWDSAPMSALVAAGDLSNISNPILVRQLSELHLSVSNLKNTYAIDQDFYNNVQVPFFIANVNMPQVANATKHAPGHPEDAYIFPRFENPEPREHSDLLPREDFRSLLVARIDKLVDISGAHRNFGNKLDKSIELIRGELAH